MASESEAGFGNFEFCKESCNNNNIEANALKALKNIEKLYEEIMGPCGILYGEGEALDGNTSETALFNTSRNNYKSDRSGELCQSCRNILSEFQLCNFCKCIKRNISACNINYSSHDKLSLNDKIRDSSKLNFTVPEPFSFTAQILERQLAKEKKVKELKEKLANEALKETKVQIHSKPVPKSTYLPLYSEMLSKQEKRKLDRKEISKQILSNNTKPFNLSYSTVKPKSTSNVTCKDINFKAKPIPKRILSSKFSETLRNREEVRKLLIAERAEQTLKQSFLPFSPKNFNHSQSLIDLKDFCKKPPSKQKTKNIDAITERLYTKKCNETLEKWDEKVSLITIADINTNDHFNNKEKHFIEMLPFTQFPVRMSHAARLREQQIKKQVTLFHELENKSKNEENICQKKADCEILNKLKMLDPTLDTEREIKERVRSYCESQRRRKVEYEKELENIIERVSKQKLLIERQSKVDKKSLSDKENGAPEKSKSSVDYEDSDETGESSQS